MVHQVDGAALDHLLQLSLRFAARCKCIFDIRPELLSILADDLVNEFVLDGRQDLDQRPVCPLEHKSSAIFDVAPQHVLIENHIVELPRRLISNIVRELAVLRLDDHRLPGLHAIDLRILALRQLVVNAVVHIIEALLVLMQ